MAIYLDCNATSPINREVSELIKHYHDIEYGNSSSRTHAFGARAKSAVETAKQQVADVVDAQKNEVVFTSGATESNNLAILGLESDLRERNKTHIITSAIEHKAVIEPCKEMESRGFDVTYLKPDKNGNISAQEFINSITEDTGLISCMQINNETGCIYPIDEIASYLDTSDSDVLLHTDAAQGFGKLIEPLRNKRIDLISISGHKIYGPKGIGALVLRRRNYKKPNVKPMMFGGDQQSNIRPGTLPVALIAGLGKACEVLQEKNSEWWNNCTKHKENCLEHICLLEPVIHGKSTLPNVINFSVPGINSEAAIVALKNIVSFSNGSACTSSSYTPSHVLESMGLSQEVISGAMRMSWCPDTPEIPWEKVVSILAGLK